MEIKGPEWAKGCEKCRYGIVGSAPAGGLAPLYLLRTIQAADGMIAFCDCQAGQSMRKRYEAVHESTVSGDEKLSLNMIEDARQWTLDHTPAPTFNGQAAD